ncbi:hypothetical protein LOTGIDRAFT_235557 [Lottia gigantea]|uniref:rRNA adenine N(6)-methyltransferase n=1 Tax=Lottia gigantea TaxID=225164 RepID=V3ZYY0_LOTGI|nr:hypothetical protein LOTGIDRAFT_235557 [Lottia gigantea]ESO86206.1 hypothetical protein LOTGIDRAFT_235557 [Lottia gigantea]
MLAKSGLTRKLIREGKCCFSLYCSPYASRSSTENIYFMKNLKRFKGYHYVHDPDVAAQIASTIKKESDNVDTMLEVNPGIGVMSAELAKLYNKLILVENKQVYLSTLQKLQETYKNIEFAENKTDYFLFESPRSFLYLRPPDVLNLVPKAQSSADIAANIFFIVPPHLDRLFAKTITHSAMAMEGIFSHGRLNWFAMVPDRFLRRLNFKKSTYSLKLKFEIELFMELKTLMELEFDSVYPKFSKTSSSSGDKTYLIKLTPKPNSDQILSSQDIEVYRLFAKQMLRNPDKRIIPRMEEFFPNCGIYLINAGFDMMQRFQDLKAEEFLNLYKSLPNLPDYQYSLWKQFLISEGFS